MSEGKELAALGGVQLVLPHGAHHAPPQPRDEGVQQVFRGLAGSLLPQDAAPRLACTELSLHSYYRAPIFLEGLHKSYST